MAKPKIVKGKRRSKSVSQETLSNILKKLSFGNKYKRAQALYKLSGSKNKNVLLAVKKAVFDFDKELRKYATYSLAAIHWQNLLAGKRLLNLLKSGLKSQVIFPQHSF